MTKSFRLTALVLALMLFFSACVSAEETVAPPVQDETAEQAQTAPAEDPVLFTFDGEEYPQSKVQPVLNNLFNNGYIDDSGDYASAIEYLVQDLVINAKISQWELDRFTPEEEAAFLAEAQQEWDRAIEDYVSYFLTEDTDEAREKARQDGDAYYRAQGFSVEMLAEQLQTQASYEALEEKMLEGQDLSVTDKEIHQVFEQYAQQHKEMYENNVSLYEFYQNYGQQSWYRPEGYRGIIHILLPVDEALLTAYQTAQATYEESLSDEEEEGDAEALKAEMDAALQAILDSKKTEIDDIYTRLEKGESFETLVAEYGTDPGMQVESTLREGYPVHRDSMTYVEAFTQGAFQEKMQQPGDVSDPVVSSFGIHILYYLRDIPGGYIEITDEIHEMIEEYLKNQKSSAVFTQTLSAWTQEHEIVYNQEAIDSLTVVADVPDAVPAPDTQPEADSLPDSQEE